MAKDNLSSTNSNRNRGSKVSGTEPTKKMSKFVDLRDLESKPRADLKEFERFTAEQPTQRMDKFKDLRFGKEPSAESSKTTTHLKGAEKTAVRQAPKAGRFRLPRLSFSTMAAVGLVGVVLGTVVFIMANRALEKTRGKMGEVSDLSRYLPKNNKVTWIAAPYTRLSRDEDHPYFEPNVVAEKVSFPSPANGIFAFGISLEGLPEMASNDVNINEMGEGNSDWLCESFSGYLICRSTSLSHPLQKDKISEVTLLFHLPGYEVKKMLQSVSGIQSVYLIVPK